MNKLIELRDKVVAGDIPDTGIDRFRAIPRRGGGVYNDPNWYAAHSAYWRGSLDEAKELHNAVLNGWEWQSGFCVAGDGFSRVTVWFPHEDDDKWKVLSATSELPARAWLIAILNALISEEYTQ